MITSMQAMTTGRAIDALFEATAQATEEAILDSIIANETMIGADGNTAIGIDHERLLSFVK